MNSFGTRKWLIYASLVAVLLALNFGRLTPVAPSPQVVSTLSEWTAIRDIQLEIARELEVSAHPARRDLFLKPSPQVVQPVVQVVRPVPPPPAAPDPQAIARVQAASTLSAIQLIGVIKGGDAFIAVLEYEERMMSLQVGDPVLSGFIVSEITTDGVRIDHAPLGVAAILTLLGDGITKLIGVDG